ncbi:hypothetical protein HanPI659440_Chr09g0352461 [Helianthus annuus]|nr:hypothetical protein HanPI659440_Chr09g0352461 [Helianthus annuus]
MSVHRYIYTNALLANYNHLPVAGHWFFPYLQKGCCSLILRSKAAEEISIILKFSIRINQDYKHRRFHPPELSILEGCCSSVSRFSFRLFVFLYDFMLIRLVSC